DGTDRPPTLRRESPPSQCGSSPRREISCGWPAWLGGSTHAPSPLGVRQPCLRAGLPLAPHSHIPVDLRPAPASSSVPLPWFTLLSAHPSAGLGEPESSKP